jgi:hypothetical protein
MPKATLSNGNPDPLVSRLDQRLASLLAALSAAAVLALSCLFAAPPIPFPTCLFRLVTGRPCPSCGLTHAFIALGHGRLAEAFRDNLMSPFLFAALAAVLIMSLQEVLTGRYFVRTLWARMKNRILVAVLAMALISWAWNMYKSFAHLPV